MNRNEISRVNFSYSQKKVCLLRKSEGFTLIELIMVVILVAVLAAMSLSSFVNLKTNAKNGRCKAEIRTIEKSILASFTDKGKLPDAMTEGEIGPDAKLVDPWSHPYIYYNISLTTDTPYKDFLGIDDLNTDFDLYSKGPNNDSTGRDLSDATGPCMDDIVRCNDGATVELGKDRNGAI